jgi:hypothetical protein
MHRHVAGDVMEDVGLRQIIERGTVTDRDGGWKFAIPQAVEKQE